MTKKYIITGLFCIAASWSQAQFVYDFLKAGDNYFAKADYASAADYYEKYLHKGSGDKALQQGFDPYKPQLSANKKDVAVSSREKAEWQLAESYRLLNYPAKAETAYKQLLEGKDDKFPLASFHLAEQLRALGKYEEAEGLFASFLKTYTVDDSYKSGAEREIKNIQFIRKELSKPEVQYYTVKAADGLLTSNGANYAPVWLTASTLLFTSTRPEQNDGHHANRLYQANLQDATVAIADVPQVKTMEQGVAAITGYGNVMYLTRWNAKGDKNAAIYVSTRQGDKWSEPVALPATVNQPGYSSQQPFVTYDGRYLLFASNKPGGEGGFDIWYTAIEEAGKVGAVMNAGKVVNTANDEQAPYYSIAAQTLVFATNGRVGMGGFDLFSSEGAVGSFNEPENLGYPVNSVKDDIYFTTKATNADILSEVWLSSDRSEACCLELFTITRKLPEPVVKTPEPDKAPEPVNDPVVVAKPTPVIDSTEGGVLTSVLYAYDKSELLDGSEASLNKLVALLQANPNMIIEIGGHTDGKGADAYNQRLSLARAQSCVNYIIGKGISADRIIAKGYGATKPVAPNTNPDGSDNPEGRKLNRRTEFTILKK
ncbi:Outer membrane protein OmpA [Filimonas lacunae]|uniref:Outer membrane protein OmpA n=1 Tax=Filimonas lacunae TaxID=477680 RepID=A0A1N7KBD7_9BACT|nr:OmpA family protein [Filimonas lacunae]SIS58849.1 Outer membrane protein OmpA [Filimonas lacunae]